MRFGKALLLLGVALAAVQIVSVAEALAGGNRMIRLADMDGGDGGDMNIDLAVRQVKVEPVRAHVGDVIHIEMVVENKDEGAGTTPAEIFANGKEVGYHLFTWGWGGDRYHHLSFAWDTKGMAPGEYHIKGTAFIYEDSSPFDNELKVTQPVLLVAPGAAFPGGETAGGTATETDPGYRPGVASGG
jgi:hypothetical protein